ncbi:MAG: TRAP transporter fused permease subunit [Syntrophobacteraceae bacterium]
MELVDQEILDSEVRSRVYHGPAAVIVGIISVAFIGWSIYGAIVPVETYVFRMVHLAFIFLLAFLMFPYSNKAQENTKWLDLGLGLLGVATIGWAMFDTDSFIRRSTLPETTDMIMGIIAIILMLEVSRRTAGTIFTCVVAFFLIYCLFGNYFPSIFSHKGYDLDRTVGHMYMTLEGLLGVPLEVSVCFVALFVAYGVFMDAAGAEKFWLELALAVMGRKHSSAGRGAILTTAFLGGPQGSGVATTMSVTPFMWPILKKAGYDPNRAAGLISTGGIGAVISPPMMGAAAFLIMQFLNVSFWTVVVMVTIPTVLYYVGTFFMVDAEANRDKFVPPESSGLTAWQVLRTHGYHLISIIVLTVMLALNIPPATGALWAIATVIATSFLGKDRKYWLTPKNIIMAMIAGAKNMMPVAILLASAGLIVGTFSLTGLGLRVSGVIMAVSNGSVIIALFMALLTSMIIGLSLPITATYIMTVIMIAPALVKVGVPMHVAHLLAFYFAVLSEVSPPVGMSPAAAAAITGGKPFPAMMQAWKYSIPAFLVPFFFAASKEGNSLLLVDANVIDFSLAFITSIGALYFLAPAVVGYFKTTLNLFERILLILLSLVMIIDPLDAASMTSFITGLIPLILGAVVLGRNRMVSARVPATLS